MLPGVRNGAVLFAQYLPELRDDGGRDLPGLRGSMHDPRHHVLPGHEHLRPVLSGGADPPRRPLGVHVRLNELRAAAVRAIGSRRGASWVGGA